MKYEGSKTVFKTEVKVEENEVLKNSKTEVKNNSRTIIKLSRNTLNSNESTPTKPVTLPVK